MCGGTAPVGVDVDGRIRGQNRVLQPGHQQLLEPALVVVPHWKTMTALDGVTGHVTCDALL